jgi:transposase
MEKVHVVSLTPKQRQHLLKVVSVGRNKANVIRRAHILLKSDEGKTDKEIAGLLYVSEETVRRTRQRFCLDELKKALADKPHPEKEKRLSGPTEGYLIALACSDPPDGAACWTLELLAQQLVEDGVVTAVSPETVRLTLKKTNSSPGG